MGSEMCIRDRSSPGLSYDTKFVHIGWELRSSLVGDTILGVQSEPACNDLIKNGSAASACCTAVRVQHTHTRSASALVWTQYGCCDDMRWVDVFSLVFSFLSIGCFFLERGVEVRGSWLFMNAQIFVLLRFIHLVGGTACDRRRLYRRRTSTHVKWGYSAAQQYCTWCI